MSEASTGGAIIPQRRSNDGRAQLSVLPPQLDAVRENAAQWMRQPQVRRMLPIGLALAGTAGVIALALNMVEPNREVLFPGMGEADKALMVETLTAQGFAVELDPATGAVTVPTADRHRARMALAAEGLPEGAAMGYDLLNEMPFGTSRAVERARLQQTQETGLAASIEEVGGVESARVHIAAPEPSAFVRDNGEPSASVFLRMKPGRVLGEEQVTAIVHLVSSSVPGLSSDKVTVIDQRGTLLSNQASGMSSISGQRLAYTKRVEDEWRQRIASILVPLYGIDSFSAEVALDLDFEAREATQERYDKEGALRSEQVSLSESAAGQRAGGIPGAISNQPPANATLEDANAEEEAPAPGPEDRDENSVRNYELNKEVSVVRKSVGDIQRASVAIVIREGEQAMLDGDLKEVEALIGGALGINKQRGDQLVVRSQKFASGDPAADIPLWEQAWVQKWAWLGVVLILGLVALFLVGRPVRKLLKEGKGTRDEDAAAMPAASAAAQGSGAAAATGGDMGAATGENAAAMPPLPALSYDDRLNMLRDLVASDARRVSAAVSDMMLKPENAEKQNA
ncbi:flagellar basal-body MS-ring/collar protein FliF [Pacificimonas sp. ICDLI1SI03]